jgi:DNA-binding transcriptional MerR regulator
MEARSYDIQELVSMSGTPRRTIYFYAQQGILPPPQGAGLAARYSDEHLLRLRLIPVLRQRGLRLDQIREEFARLDVPGMQALLAQSGPAALVPLPQPIPGGWPAGQPSLRYDLPGGFTLFVPGHLSPADSARLQRILRAALANHPPFQELSKSVE